MTKVKTIELAPIKETTEDFERAERAIIELFRKEVYFPVLASIQAPKNVIQNAKYDLREAIRTGRVQFSRGTFSGKFNAEITKELKSLGARWDRKSGTFKITQSELPLDIRSAVAASETRMIEKFAAVDKKLAQMIPEEIADKLKVEQFFDTALWKTERDFQSSIKGITITPKLSDEARKKIAAEWQNNMRLFVKDFTQKQIKDLRKDVQTSVFSGNRYESMISKIQKNYGVTENKAKFLARQETSLLMTKYKEGRYTDAGVKEYVWGCVAGSKNHPVRPWHKALEGKTFSWNNPPITTKPGEPVRRNNPGQDFNCRCFAKPIVRFSK